MSLGGGLQGITVTPKFIFGVNGELRRNVHLIDNHKLLYTAGHNIVIYNLEDKTQDFLPGTEGTEGITAVAISTHKKHIAICEKGPTRAMCHIFDVVSRRKRKTTPEAD